MSIYCHKNLLPLVLLSMSLLLTSCDPVNALAKNLAGDWKITSFLLDGEEQIGNYQYIEYRFGAYNGDQGTFNFTSVQKDGSELVRKGDYQLNEEGTQLDLILQDSSLVVLTHDVRADKESLELTILLGTATHEYRGVRK